MEELINRLKEITNLSELENIELPLGLSIEQDLYVPKRTDLMTAMIRDGMRVPDFIKNNYIASDRCNFESIIILQPNLTDAEKSKVQKKKHTFEVCFFFEINLISLRIEELFLLF